MTAVTAPSTPVRVGVIGCGAIGRIRAGALGADDLLVAATDVDPAATQTLVAEHGGEAVADAAAVLAARPDVVVVATVHSALADLTCQALEAGAHVLVEKPAGISLAEIERIAETARRARRLVKVGFNHRFHPGIEHAIDLARSGRFGELMFMRGRYGHGARLGYETEWRMDRLLSGGGELVDQGMHLLDLSHAVLGEVPLHAALLRSQFWAAEVEDNAALILGDAADRSGRWAQLHVTWTEWKNMFSLEITCRTGKITVDGLARSYGPQVVHVYTMLPEMGPPEVERIEYAAEDVSWRREWAHFREAVVARDPGALLRGDLASARYAWEQVERAYELQSPAETRS